MFPKNIMEIDQPLTPSKYGPFKIMSLAPTIKNPHIKNTKIEFFKVKTLNTKTTNYKTTSKCAYKPSLAWTKLNFSY